MLTKSELLLYYKQADVQNAIFSAAKNKEVASRYNESFGKRPDMLQYPNEILELVKQGATSFHCSEELWSNPLQLNAEMNTKELDRLRIGWDLIIDVDCKYWEYSKLITHLIIKALHEHGVKSVSCKFSGNKGFHIGVPFKAFPEKVHGIETRLLFPESTRRILRYLVYYIDNKANNFELTKSITSGKTNEQLANELGKPIDEIIKTYCENCGAAATEEKKSIEFTCPLCGASEKSISDEKFKVCGKCKKIMEKRITEKKMVCKQCSSKKFMHGFNSKSIIDVDAILISSRHLYRMPYSMHEKSGLVSVVIPPEKVLEFDQESAKPECVKTDMVFLDDKNTIAGEASQLIIEAFDFKPNIVVEEEKKSFDYEELKEEIPEQLFPPCVKKILSGLKDGRKRSLFVLINFLSCCGYTNERIEQIVFEWNKKNTPVLKLGYVISQLKHHNMQKEKIPPPNCPVAPDSYYSDTGICSPDNLCGKIKNPVNYAKRKVWAVKKESKRRE